MRKTGFYWIKNFGYWEVALWIFDEDDQHWLTVGNEIPFPEADEVGDFVGEWTEKKPVK